ncbi:MAG: serine hydrolase [Thermomicrobiales bacterium]|nr:serine hydrolase [Thermomicrobiales bacterium]
MVDWTGVEAEIEAVVKRGGEASVAIIAPDGTRFSARADEPFRAASTMKISVMIEIFRRFERGESKPDDIQVLTDALRTPGSGVLPGLHAGLELTVADNLYLMIAISDNTATNFLIDLAGIDTINRTLNELGIEQSLVRRRMLGRMPGPNDQENWILAGEMVDLLHLIMTDRAASPESCAAMRDLLRTQQCTRRISRFLPEGTDWGSKTGSLDFVCNDVGFAMTPAGPLCLAIYTRGLDDVDGELAIASITRAAWSAVTA